VRRAAARRWTYFVTPADAPANDQARRLAAEDAKPDVAL